MLGFIILYLFNALLLAITILLLLLFIIANWITSYDIAIRLIIYDYWFIIYYYH